jgi:hypothetical protein
MKDLDGSVYTPSLDDLALINTATGSRAAESGTLSTQIVTDAASVVAYGPATVGLTSYSTDDADVLHLAQSVVAGNRTPGFRLPQLQADLATSENNLYAAVAAVEIGSRVRVTSLPVGQAPATQTDVLVEGMSESLNVDSYLVRYDTSPADNPPLGVWDDPTYGRWQAAGQTLTATVTAGASSIQVTTSAGNALFTTVSGRYPLTIQVDAEQITLTAAPGGSSPQTFTSITRGVNGTSAAGHTAGAVVNLAPAVTYTL